MTDTLESFAIKRLGSLAALARETGISDKLLKSFSDGEVAPDKAHARRILQVLGRDIDASVIAGHTKPKVEALEVSEARVLAKRDEYVVRPHSVKADDLIRFVTSKRGVSENLQGWVKVKKDARWIRGDTVGFELLDGTMVECHPAQTVTVARKRKDAEATPIQET